MQVDPLERPNEPGPVSRESSPDMVRTLERATAHLDLLVEQLDASLDVDQRRQLHQVRRAAELVGSLRAALELRGGC